MDVNTVRIVMTAAASDAWRTFSSALSALPDTLHPALTPFKSVIWASVLSILITALLLGALTYPSTWTRRLLELGLLMASAVGAVTVVGIGCAQHLPRAPDGRRLGAFVPVEACDGALRPWFDGLEAMHVRAFALYMGALASVIVARACSGGGAAPSRKPLPTKFDSVLFRSIGGGMTEVVCRKDRDVTRYVMHAEDVANTAWTLF